MALGRLLMHVGWTLLFPGVGQGVAGRRWMAIAWMIAGLGVAIAVTATVWALFAALAIRVACGVDAAVRLRACREEKRVVPIIASVVGAAGIVFFWTTTERFEIPTDSMTPTIAIGDVVYISTIGRADRGDVIVFAHPCERRSHIKRVVAKEGDTVELRCGKLYINGKVAGEGYAKDFPGELLRSCRGSVHGATVATDGTGCQMQRHYIVPDDTVFVLGDNRTSSNDSRDWGVVPLENIEGRAIGIAWPLSHASAL